VIAERLQRDLDATPPANLRAIQSKVFRREAPRHRLADAAAALTAYPGDHDYMRVYLAELFTMTARQVGPGICLGPTFVRMVRELPSQLLEAMSPWTRTALQTLADRAGENPIPLVFGGANQAANIAHALTLEDGSLVTWLAEDAPEKPAEGPEKVFRRLAMELHPDRPGGNAEAMAALSELWKATKRAKRT
jgi:hypothetical protein